MNGEPLTQVYPVIMPPRSREAFERSGQTPWDAFLDKYGVSPTPPSDIPGSDFAGRLFAHEYLVDFPIDGDYVFRGLCDNEGLVYLDSENPRCFWIWKDKNLKEKCEERSVQT